jgi:hypothetical protein
VSLRQLAALTPTRMALSGCRDFDGVPPTAPFECHRGHFENDPPFQFPEWKFEAAKKGDPELCHPYGKNKNGSGKGPCRGFSMWFPHVCPTLLMVESGGRRVRCKILTDSHPLPTDLCILHDRAYSAVVNDKPVNFVHYLLVPCGSYDQDRMLAASTTTGEMAVDCGIITGSGAHVLEISFDDCERAVGCLLTAQCAMGCFVGDDSNSVASRCDAMVLYAWMGSLEATINDIVYLSPSAGEFILEVMKMYRSKLSEESSSFLINFGDATQSLQYQVDRHNRLLLE